MITNNEHSVMGSPYNRFFNIVRQYIFEKSLSENSETGEYVEVLIDMETINKHFTSIVELQVATEYCTDFSLSKLSKEDFEIHKLLFKSIFNPEDGLSLYFNKSILLVLQNNKKGYSIANSNTLKLLKTASAQLIYNWCCKKSCYGQFSFTPEQLKELFSVNYLMANLSDRILKPAKEQLDDLYATGESHLTFDYTGIRSATGHGAKTVLVDFKIRNRFFESYLEAVKSEHLATIKMIINDNFIYNGNIINAQIDYMDCYQIDSLYNRITDLSSHPDINISPASDIIRHILLFKYGVRADKIPAIADMFTLPPTPRQYKEAQIAKRKKEIASKKK